MRIFLEKKISEFITKHHLLTLSTISSDQSSSCCNLFYAFDEIEISFIVASEYKSEHIQNILKNSKVSGTIAQETKIVGRIQGVQFKAQMKLSEYEEDKERYFKNFPYAKVMNPTLWKIELESLKFTDNTLGFGRKLIWQR